MLLSNVFPMRERRVAGLRYLLRSDVIEWLRWEANDAEETTAEALRMLAATIEEIPFDGKP